VSRDSDGFTLLEVVIALAILGLAVVAAIQGFAHGLRLLKLAGDHQQAILIADQKARELVTPTAGNEEGTEGVYSWQRTAKEVPAPELTPTGTTPAWRVYEITVQVNWASRHVELATLRVVPTSQQTSATPITAVGQPPGQVVTTPPTGSSTGTPTARPTPTPNPTLPRR
jgi:type II secretion system protein I